MRIRGPGHTKKCHPEGVLPMWRDDSQKANSIPSQGKYNKMW